ncbi:MAG: glycerol-3-phosphate acyltransferase, partial [Rickettsiales bacterium]|jgi:glycerol-3-phosphate acyltransferase PlsY|nr:glycerol-3-phosphate acyltransferase [Rickettsiales bacterium]
MINPFIFMVSGIEWLIVATITGYSSLGAIVCFFVMGFLGFAISPAIGAIVSAAAAVCLFQHRENIRRLLNGTESKIKNVRKLAIGLFIIGVILVGVSLLCYV